MNTTDDSSFEIPSGATVMLANDILRNIIEGDTRTAEGLTRNCTQFNLVLLKTSLCEALATAASPTCEGLRALAGLIAVSEIEDDS